VSKTAGYSTSEVARFDSPEVLACAWFTLPLCDVLRSVQVGVAFMNTRRTVLTGMVRIELLDSDASALGLVRDELLEWWKYNEWTSDYKQFSRIPLGSSIRMVGFSNCSANVIG
jgi:hypothetical protein